MLDHEEDIKNDWEKAKPELCGVPEYRAPVVWKEKINKNRRNFQVNNTKNELVIFIVFIDKLYQSKMG